MVSYLQIEGLTKRFGATLMYQNVSMELSEGQRVAIVAKNGAGKTTSFYMITGLIKPNSGKIFLDDEEITKLAMYERAQKGLGYLAQEASVFRKLSVEDNLLAVMEMVKIPKKERMEKLESLIDEFGLHKVRKSYGIQLSGASSTIPVPPTTE